MKKRILQLELNEVSESLVRRLIERGHLPNFKKVLENFGCFQTVAENKYENLEPWIQWVTVHTGKTFEEHNIFRLGDNHQLRHDQIWELLSDAGFESTIVGCMNSNRGRMKEGFYLPDPWSKKNDAYPEGAQHLWRFISRGVQAHATREPKWKELWSGAAALKGSGVSFGLICRIGFQLVWQKFQPKVKWRLAALFDEFLAEIFFEKVNRSTSEFNALFLNSVAHFQHHYWRQLEPELFEPSIKTPDCRPKDNPLLFGLQIFDRILGKFLSFIDGHPNTLLIVTTGLSQEPFLAKEKEGGMNYYRLASHSDFCFRLGIPRDRVFPLMSRDWQLRFDSEVERVNWKNALESLKLGTESLFRVDQNVPGYLFVETAVTRSVSSSEEVIDARGNSVGRFLELFVNTAIKSGAHSTVGSLWLSGSSTELSKFQGSRIPLKTVFSIPLTELIQ